MSVNKVNSDGTVTRIAGGTLYADAPLGTILAYGGATAPAGWMLCQGQAISRTTYAKLYEIIGTAFGSGDGSTTFNLPDLRGEFLRGAGNNSHADQGNGGSVGAHQDATQLPSMYVASNAFQFGLLNETGEAVANIDKNVATNKYTQFSKTVNSAAGYGTITTRPTNTSVNYIIKVMMVSLPADLQKALDDELDACVGFIDTSKIVKINTGIVLNDTYTATENCWMRILLQNGSGAYAGVVYTVDNININGYMSNSTFKIFIEVPLKKGQVVKFTEVQGTLATAEYLVFGIKK